MLTAADARLLDRLSLTARGLSATTGSPARHHANTRGHGLEFHDFRAYQPGDDLRTIDWTVHARLRQLVVRTAHAEAQLRLHLLVDVSRSMSLGRPAKLACAKRIAAALAYVAVARREAVGVTTFDNRLRAVMPPASGRGQLSRLFSTLTSATVTEHSALNRALLAYGSLTRGPGLVIILSDFFDSPPPLDAVRYLLHRGLQPALLQIASDEEIEPTIDGEVELRDVERSDAPPVIAGTEAVTAYRLRLSAWLEGLESFCRREGIPWVPIRTSQTLDAVLAACCRAGLVVNHS